MKYNIMVNEIKWSNTNDEPTFIEFSVYKKGLFGGLKEVKDYEGSCLGFIRGKDGEVDLDYFHLMDGNFQAIPFNPHLVICILQAAQLTMSETGDEGKAQILRNASRGFFSKYILGGKNRDRDY